MVHDDQLHLSPIGDHPLKILDLGTGTGTWAMQVADKYPSAEVIGIDIAPVQPQWVPPNLNYEVDDLEQEWLYTPSSFDLIYVRFMFMAVRDWPEMLARAYRAAKPGGFVELSELGCQPRSSIPDHESAPTISQWFTLQGDVLRRQGYEISIARRFKDLLLDAGFVDVVEQIRDIPWGTWPSVPKQRAVGYWHVEQLKQGMHGIVMASMTRAGWTRQQVDDFVGKIMHEMDDMSYRTMDKA